MKTLYIVIWHEAIEVEDLISGIFTTEQQAESLCESLCAESSGDYWEVITKDVNI